MSDAMLEYATREKIQPRAELAVSEHATREDLERLLQALVEEDCVHSWRNFTPGGTVSQLLRWENERRPTKLFFFYLHETGSSRMVAAAAIAERLKRDFPHAGFPVLGRCCIMPEYRGRGLYRQILHYRLEYCRTRYADTLKAVHIGAVNERIARVITDHGLPGWPRFVHLGEEELDVAGDKRRVGAYQLLMPAFLERMLTPLAAGGTEPGAGKLRHLLATVESGAVRNLGALLRETFAEIGSSGRWPADRPPEVEQFLRFCSAIPLVGFCRENPAEVHHA